MLSTPVNQSPGAHARVTFPSKGVIGLKRKNNPILQQHPDANLKLSSRFFSMKGIYSLVCQIRFAVLLSATTVGFPEAKSARSWAKYTMIAAASGKD
eukprot:1330471-Amorphochlora_amoeboformis.AAC.2